MENPDTLILNLTFLGTVGMALLMFLVLFLLGVITLLLAGIGRLTAVMLKALFSGRANRENLTLARHGRASKAMHNDGASAVAEADARALARARTAAPEIKLSVRDLPDPQGPADKVVEVAPLVESGLDNHRPGRVPQSFAQAQAPRPPTPLDAGSPVSSSGRAPVQAALKNAPPQGTAGKGTSSQGSSPTENPHMGKQPLP